MDSILQERQAGSGHARALRMLCAAALCAGSALSHAQTVIGSAGAAFQSWTLADLNNNGAPFWDAPTRSFGAYSGNPDSKNVGFCLTSSGDCAGIGSHAAAPGPLAYWGMPFDAVNDSGGAMDPKVYFRHSHGQHRLKATLELQFTTVSGEVNEFGWFETDAAGSVVKARHVLFHGGGVPPGSATPDPVGKTVTFKPSEYFGYYFSDVSEGGCLAYTLSGFNEAPSCTDHDFVVFSKDPGASRRLLDRGTGSAGMRRRRLQPHAREGESGRQMTGSAPCRAWPAGRACFRAGIPSGPRWRFRSAPSWPGSTRHARRDEAPRHRPRPAPARRKTPPADAR